MKSSPYSLLLLGIESDGRKVDVYVNGCWVPQPAEIKKGDRVEIKKKDYGFLKISYIEV